MTFDRFEIVAGALGGVNRGEGEHFRSSKKSRSQTDVVVMYLWIANSEGSERRQAINGKERCAFSPPGILLVLPGFREPVLYISDT